MAQSQQDANRGEDLPLTLDRLAIKSSNSKPLKHLIGMRCTYVSRRNCCRDAGLGVDKDCEAEAPAALQHHPKMLDSAPTELVTSSPLGSPNNFSSYKIVGSFCKRMTGQRKKVSGLCGRGTI